MDKQTGLLYIIQLSSSNRVIPECFNRGSRFVDSRLCGNDEGFFGPRLSCAGFKENQPGMK